MKVKKKVIFIVGPTASGKTAVGAALAKKTGAEVISCDSMQIYKGMDIITSKPPLSLIKKTPHHLIGQVSPCLDYDVSRYRRAAVKKAREILDKGKVPVFVGGTGLYMSVLLDGIFRQKAAGPLLRRRLYKLADKRGSLYLYKRLCKVDPEAARKIHPNDLKRLIRALEVYEATGQPISRLQKKRRGLSADHDVRIFCLDIKRPLLYRRIEERVDVMFRKGLAGEVKKLLRLKLGRSASCAIGIKELKECFEGQYGLEEARRLIKLATRRYAKRQLTWFRKDARIKWIKVTEDQSPKETAQRIWKECF